MDINGVIMGQPVNPLLGNYQTMLGADPELYRQQLIQQEQARIAALPAQSQLGAQLGSLLGRGLTNVAQDRGFFEVTNPVLQKPGLGVQALMANQERRRVEGDLIKARGEELKTKSAQIDYYAKNPDELMSEITKQRASGTEEGNNKANELAGLLGQVTYARDLDRAKQIADIELKGAQTEAQRAQARNFQEQIASGKYDFKIIAQNGVTPSHIVIIDKKTGEERVKPLSQELFGAAPGTTPTKPSQKPTSSSMSLEGYTIVDVK